MPKIQSEPGMPYVPPPWDTAYQVPHAVFDLSQVDAPYKKGIEQLPDTEGPTWARPSGSLDSMAENPTRDYDGPAHNPFDLDPWMLLVIPTAILACWLLKKALGLKQLQFEPAHAYIRPNHDPQSTTQYSSIPLPWQ
ncbi:hypothetical protein HY642_01340 [Candidatus Woesearchaeota archaeon]|nr:hypothetical protein [Candidatus Woesearchaeota archaeon]